MTSRFAAAVCLFCAVPVSAQPSASPSKTASSLVPSGDADARMASVNVHASPRGNVTISLHLDSSFADAAPGVLAAIPAVLGCDWVSASHDSSSTNGICRTWLTKKKASLRR